MSRNSDNIPLDAPPELDKALSTLEERMGGRDKVAASLAVIPNLTVEEQTIFQLMTDPANRKRSLAYLCGAAGTTVGRVLELFSKGDWAQAYVDSIRRVNALLPQVAEDVMTRALPKWKGCVQCKGAGRMMSKKPLLMEGKPTNPPIWEEIEVECFTCEGVGKIEVEPDIERQKVALQVGGLLKTGGGVTIDNSDKRTQISGGVTLIKSSPDFRAATDMILYPGKQRARLPPATSKPANFEVEAEIIKEPSVLDTPDQ